MNEKIIEILIDKLYENKEKYNYINLKSKNEYAGWVTNFNLKLIDGQTMCLDLTNEQDLFLLFVLAIAWSRTGPWENAAYFVTYLKVRKLDSVEFWLNEENVSNEEKNRNISANTVLSYIAEAKTRKKISFRKDIYKSIHLLAKNWINIKISLAMSNKTGEYKSFMYFMRNIEGLGVKNRKMFIKIPLILRELRCQNIYENIPGNFCCVPDARVKDACKELQIKLPTLTLEIDSLIKVSSVIYDYFGNLYDLPLFAYQDIKEQLVV